MIHPTYRSLDAPVKLLGLSWRQWLWLVLGGGGLIAVLHYGHVPTRPAISVGTILIGVPLALAYLGEETGFGAGRLLVDMLRWRFAPRDLQPGAGEHLPALVVTPDAADSEPAPAPATQGLDW